MTGYPENPRGHGPWDLNTVPGLTELIYAQLHGVTDNLDPEHREKAILWEGLVALAKGVEDLVSREGK